MRCARTENYRDTVVVSLAEVREGRKSGGLREKRRAEREALAEEWRWQLASGEVESRAALARRGRGCRDLGDEGVGEREGPC